MPLPDTHTAVRDAPGDDWAPMLDLFDEITTESSLNEIYLDLASTVDDSPYSEVGPEEFLHRYRANAVAIIGRIRERRGPAPGEQLPSHRGTGRLRAQRGVPLSDVVKTTLSAQRAFTAHFARRAFGAGICDEIVTETLQYLAEWNAQSTSDVIAGYQEMAIADAASKQRRARRALRRLLGGGLTAAQVRQATLDTGLNPDGTYFVLRADTDSGRLDEVRAALTSGGSLNADAIALTTMYGDVCAVTAEKPDADLPFLVGASPSVGVADLAEGLRLATRSIDVARLVGMTGLVSLDRLSILATLATDHDVVQVLRDRYITPLLELGSTGEAILHTVATYLEHQRSTVETAQTMFVHANTVRYRIERFEELTGCSLRSIRTVAEVWWILHLHNRGEHRRASLDETDADA